MDNEITDRYLRIQFRCSLIEEFDSCIGDRFNSRIDKLVVLAYLKF